MKKLNDFFEKAPLWQIYIFGWVLTSLFTAGIFFGLDHERFPLIKALQIGATMGIIIGVMLMLSVSTMRGAQKFYEDCNILEDKVKAAKSREELGDLYFRDFTELRKRASHNHMYSRLREIHTRMQAMVGFLSKTSAAE